MPRIKLNDVNSIDVTEEDYQNFLKWQSSQKKEKAFQEIREIWENFVSLNHHKNRDFDFTIYLTYDFLDNKFNCWVRHRGYITDYSTSKKYQSEQADEAIKLSIADCILKNFRSVENWCSDVVKNSYEYELEQVKQAKYYFENKNRLDILRQVLYN